MNWPIPEFDMSLLVLKFYLYYALTLPQGYYYFIATDANGCTESETPGVGQFIEISCNNTCANAILGGGGALGPYDATNSACDNGTLAYQGYTSSSYWTITIYSTTTAGQISGGTLFPTLQDGTQYSSGQTSSIMTLPQGEYYLVIADASGCPTTGIYGQGNSFTVGCTY